MGLGSFTLGKSQKDENPANFWNDCHFRFVKLVIVAVILLIRLRDLIVNDFEFCGQVNLAGIFLKTFP